MGNTTDKKVGKGLSALLQILRSNGVTRYQTPDLTLELGPAPPPKFPSDRLDVSAEALARAHAELADKDDEDEGDPRFLLERLQRHYPRAKADPRRNGGTQ